MTDEERIYRRVLRRETHASRTAAASVVSVAVLLLALALLIGGVWWAVDAGFRETVAAQVAGATAPAVLIAIGIVALLLAAALLALALLPGRLSRRARLTPRAALLVDDGVLADAIADAVAGAEGVDRRQVSVTLGRRAAFVRVTPTSGLAIDADRVARTANRELARLGFTVTTRVDIAERGVVA